MKRRVALWVGVGAYAWLATGVEPFSLAAYVVVGVPSLGVTVLAWRCRHLRTRCAQPASYVVAAPPIRITPWLILLGVSLVLETVALAAGGHSVAIPTLSTTIDHLLTTHAERWLLYVLWLSVGAAPWWRGRRSSVNAGL